MYKRANKAEQDLALRHCRGIEDRDYSTCLRRREPAEVEEDSQGTKVHQRPQTATGMNNALLLWHPVISVGGCSLTPVSLADLRSTPASR